MDKRTAWVSWALGVSIFLGIGGMTYSMHHGQAERLDVLQRATKEKDNQISQMNDQLKEQKQSIEKLQQQLDTQQKLVEEVQKKGNF
jgi:TolA-binding protein